MLFQLHLTFRNVWLFIFPRHFYCYKVGHSLPLFLHFRLVSKIWWRLDLNRSLLLSGMTTLSTVPHRFPFYDYFLKNGPTPASFCLFSFFSIINFTEKTVGFSGIRTRIVRLEGEFADHLTTTTTAQFFFYSFTEAHFTVLNHL